MWSKSGVKNKIIYVIIFALYLFCIPQPVQAKETSLPPHLIQAVNDQDIYEGLVALGFLECETLEEEDLPRAYEIVKDCVVRVNMGNAYGSGVIWQFTNDSVIIATNEHVLEYWDDMLGFIYFSKGYFVNARVLGISDVYDVGFLVVDREELGYEALESLCHVNKDETAFENLSAGDDMFCVGAGREIGDVEYHEGTIEDKMIYIDDFNNKMLYGNSYARAGMSGGGVFDGYGHFIGMLTGGTLRNEIAAVPLPFVVDAWEEVSGSTALE